MGNKIVAVILMCIAVTAGFNIGGADSTAALIPYAVCFKGCHVKCLMAGLAMHLCQLKCNTDCMSKVAAGQVAALNNIHAQFHPEHAARLHNMAAGMGLDLGSNTGAGGSGSANGNVDASGSGSANGNVDASGSGSANGNIDASAGLNMNMGMNMNMDPNMHMDMGSSSDGNLQSSNPNPNSNANANAPSGATSPSSP